MEENFNQAMMEISANMTLEAPANDNLGHLPAELLEEIAENLKLSDVLSLTLTCKRINQIIFTSPKIMKRMILKLEDLGLLHDVLFARHYLHLDISAPLNMTNTLDEEAFMGYAQRLKGLIFSCETTASFVQDIMKMCENVEEVHFNEFCLKSGKPARGLFMPQSKLTSLCTHESGWLLGAFKTFALKKLHVHAMQAVVFPEVNNWQLKEIFILRAVEKICRVEDFQLFLLTQVDHLEILSVTTENRDLAAFIINEMKSLKTFNIIVGNRFSPFFLNDKALSDPNLNLTELTIQTQNSAMLIHEQMVFNFLRQFPALEKLTLDFIEYFTGECEELLRMISLPRLKYLKVHKASSKLLRFATLPTLKTLCVHIMEGNDNEILPNVKSLIIKNMRVNLCQVGTFYPNIESLRIENGIDMSYVFIVPALKYSLTKLKSMKVSRSMLGDWGSASTVISSVKVTPILN